MYVVNIKCRRTREREYPPHLQLLSPSPITIKKSSLDKYNKNNGCPSHWLDWIVQCFTSPPTQYRLYGRRFLQVKRTNQQYQSTEGKSTKDKSNNGNNTKQTCI